MKETSKLFPLAALSVVCISVFSGAARAACDCGSTDANNPCAGQSITVTVPAGGIYNWEFNSGGGNARCGQFANGDYWIAPADGQSSVTVTAISTTSSGTIYADENPVNYSYGFLTHPYNGYDARQNIIPNLPISYSSDTSLAAVIQRDVGVEGGCTDWDFFGNQCINSWNTVTILDSVPTQAGSTTIRPAMAPTTKELLTLSDFDLSRIPSISYFAGADTVELERIRVRWSHSSDILSLAWSPDGGTTYIDNYVGRSFRAYALVPDYAAGNAKTWHDDLAKLFSSSTPPSAERTKALAAMITYGMDLYAVIFNNQAGYSVRWGNGGAGQHLGKFPPVAFMAALERNNPVRLNNVKNFASLPNTFQPQELGQLHAGPNGPVWGDTESITRYWTDMVASQCYDTATSTCNPNLNQKTAADPYKYIDGPPNQPGSGYFGIGYAGILNFTAIMHLWPDFKAVVNSNKPIVFVDRAMSHGLKTLPDPVVTPDIRENFGVCNVWQSGSNCQYYYPTASVAQTWGPKSLTDDTLGAVTTATTGYTQQGRFASMDGNPAPINLSYVSRQLYDNWDVIKELHSQRRLFRNVRIGEIEP